MLAREGRDALAAFVIAFQLGLTHWFYLYIPWFFPALICALIGAFPTEIGVALAADEEAEAELAQPELLQTPPASGVAIFSRGVGRSGDTSAIAPRTQS